MTNSAVLRVAMEQSALEASCAAADFCGNEPVVTIARPHPKARLYIRQPLLCDFVSYGNNVVATVREDLAETVKEYLGKNSAEHCFETPNIHALSERIAPFGLKICFMAEYFLPNMDVLRPLSCPYETRMLEKGQFDHLYQPQWSNALCQKRSQLDSLCVGAYDGDMLVGLAGASADCESMWQIGIDVLPGYRRQGVASALTSRLACEIVKREKVPFYCAAWCNVKSVRNAIRSGFRPAWVQMTAWEREFVDGMI